MKGSRRLKAMDERKSHVTEWMATKRKNESSKWTDNIMYERTNKPNNRTSEMIAKQTEKDQWHEQTPANPATQQMAEIHLKYFFFETKEKYWTSLV